jgi:hypothetical protein
MIMTRLSDLSKKTKEARGDTEKLKEIGEELFDFLFHKLIKRGLEEGVPDENGVVHSTINKHKYPINY